MMSLHVFFWCLTPVSGILTVSAQYILSSAIMHSIANVVAYAAGQKLTKFVHFGF